MQKHQVFISSTFEDLKDVRQQVSNALLRADCFPAGMELFPAADLEQFELIKEIIDSSDYYVIISAGRYGSIHPDLGISYTEMEYDYALKAEIPIIRLLHRDPFSSLSAGVVESSDERRDKLKTFRKKLMNAKLVRFWDEYSDVEKELLYGILDIKKRFPRPGWVHMSRMLPDLFAALDPKLDKIYKRHAEDLARVDRSFERHRAIVKVLFFTSGFLMIFLILLSVATVLDSH